MLDAAPRDQFLPITKEGLLQQIVDPVPLPPLGTARLDLLRPKDRLIITLRFMLGLETQTIGALMGIGPDAARMRLARAIKKANSLSFKG